MSEEYMTLQEAREFLGISRPTMWRVLKDGDLPVYADPLDKRKKLVKREDVERLKQPRKVEPLKK